MKKFILATAALMAATSAQAVAPLNIVWNPGSAVIPVGQTMVETFGVGADVSFAGYGFLNGDSSLGARPAFDPLDNTRYLSVFGNGTFLYTLTTASSLFGFDLGSLDTYNRLIVTFADSSTVTLDGAQIRGAATPTPLIDSGDQDIPATNGRLTYSVGAGNPLITSVRFSSITSNSFEVDRFTVANAVPEAATWMMMLLGFGFVGGAIRYRRRNVPVLA